MALVYGTVLMLESALCKGEPRKHGRMYDCTRCGPPIRCCHLILANGDVLIATRMFLLALNIFVAEFCTGWQLVLLERSEAFVRL